MMARKFRSGPTAFGEFDFAEELAALTTLPTHQNLFADKGIPSLAVYRRKKPSDYIYRGHAKVYSYHIHVTITKDTCLADGHELVAHELAHHISHFLGHNGTSGDHRERYHHRKFDEILRTLIFERHGFDIPVGERTWRYDYSHRVDNFLRENMQNGMRMLFDMEAAVAPQVEKRAYTKRTPDALWGWKILREKAVMKPQANQMRALNFIIDPHQFSCEHDGIPYAYVENEKLYIPLNTDTVSDLVDELMRCPTDEKVVWQAADKLSERISLMYRHVCMKRSAA